MLVPVEVLLQTILFHTMAEDRFGSPNLLFLDENIVEEAVPYTFVPLQYKT